MIDRHTELTDLPPLLREDLMHLQMFQNMKLTKNNSMTLNLKAHAWVLHMTHSHAMWIN